MQLGAKIGILAGISVVVMIGIVILMGVSYSNAEIKTRNLVTAQKGVIEANYDKMWKVIKQVAQVPDQAADKFKEMYQPLIEGRYEGKDSPMMKWVTESNPQFDWGLYGKLQTAIEANRTDFFYEQKKLISIKKQHDDLRKTLPSSIFVGSRDEIDIIIISSAKTKAVMASGLEDDVDLFKKN